MDMKRLSFMSQASQKWTDPFKSSLVPFDLRHNASKIQQMHKRDDMNAQQAPTSVQHDN